MMVEDDIRYLQTERFPKWYSRLKGDKIVEEVLKSNDRATICRSECSGPNQNLRGMMEIARRNNQVFFAEII